jgi:hypothetical protein
MRIVKLRIDGQMFILEPGNDVGELKAQIVAAVRDGASFIYFSTVGHREVSVLVTAQIPVRFEVIEKGAEEYSQWEQHPPSYEDHLDEVAQLIQPDHSTVV